MLIGYARVSTAEQQTRPQLRELRAAGCATVHEEYASGGARARPVLAGILQRIAPGDTLVVVRIDRLARSLVHLLEVIDTLERRGAHFRSLRDPIDTASPQGKFTLQVLGAAAELERALIRERTIAGLASARAAGRIGGNPGLRQRDPDALRKVRLARDETYFRRIEGLAGDWVPLVRKHRPAMAWADLVRLVNARRSKGTAEWTQERLRRAARRFVENGLLEATVLDRAPARASDDRLLVILAAIRNADPAITLKAICRRLEAMHEPTPRGARIWYPSSVRHLLARAERLGLLPGTG